jgi:long-chain fatty acid transport protein
MLRRPPASSRARIIVRWLLSSVCVLVSAAPAAAQSSLQVPIQFDFLNPSARSLALGSAFVGLADDATAALVNPAGLVALTRKELSAEGRYRRFEQPFLAGGRLSGIPTGAGQDTVGGPQFETIADSNVAPNFVSFVYPHKSFRVAAFRHALNRLDQDFSSRGPFQSHGFDTRDTAFAAARTIAVDTYGLSAAADHQRVWLGAGLLVQRFSLGFEFDRFLHENFYGEPDPRLSVFHFSQAGNDTAIAGVVGAMIPLPTVKIGLSYKRSPRFDFSSFSGGLAGSQQRTHATFKIPDVFALGASIAPHTSLVISTEYTRVLHSQLRADYLDVLVNQGESRDRADRFTIKDANEFHVGAEYLVPVAGRPGIRAGAWFDPDHSVHYRPTDANDLLDERIAAYLSSGRDLWHYTFGTMIAVHPRLDLSAAVDRSSRSLVLSTSVVLYF